MKKILFPLLFMGMFNAISQTAPVKVAKNANHFVYASYDYGENIDTQYTQIEIHNGPDYLVTKGNKLPNEFCSRPWVYGPNSYIKGYCIEDIFVNELTDTITCLTTIFDGDLREQYRTLTPFSRPDIQFDTTCVNRLTRYTCFINSNRLEFYVQPFKTSGKMSRGNRKGTSRCLSPVPHYGRFPGLLVSFWRNGQCLMQLTKTEHVHSSNFSIDTTTPLISSRKLSAIKRQKMVVTSRIFDNVQLCWNNHSDHIEGDILQNTPFDSVLHFAGGTLALKRIRLPQLPAHYQTFVEIHQRSNGDAYDRTGSLFVVPVDTNDPSAPTFFRGINEHPDSLPIFTDRVGGRYQGILSTNTYRPPVELVRFFTSFGAGHFNDRIQIDDLQWKEENYYKQEVTELSCCLQGEVWIGVWIGNYDSGGHYVTVDIKSYPNDYNRIPPPNHGRQVIPLFNTCNVLEMTGQNYGRFFGSDSLTVSFTIPDSATKVRLRYITTGHGGWDGGDEFNPKTNTILVDGKIAYTYTPWRCDCARYREWNPVSGNFWNGLSSSDFSRSGWCPGTATLPVFFDLSSLAVGTHTLTVAIPQGQNQAGSFSHWCVSGAVIYDK